MTANNDVETDITDIIGGGAQKKTKIRWVMYSILAGIVLIVVFIFLFSGKSNSTGTRYEKKTVEQGNLTNTVSATGNLEPTNQVEVGSELSGIVDAVYADYNDAVTVGQVLALLDTAKLEAKVKQSKAALDSTNARVLQAKATLKETKVKLARMQQAHELSGGKVPSLFDIEAAEAAFERAEADLTSALAAVDEAKATLDSNREDLSKAKILSPINGIVLDRSVELGQTVAASLQAPVLFTLAEDLTQMELHVDVDEADVGMVKMGQIASFTVDAYPDKTFSAEITQVRYGAQITEGVVTYETVLKVDNSELLLRPGMTATADIIVQKVENKTLVPNAALRFKPREMKNENRNNDNSNTNSSMISKIFPRRPGRGNRPDNASNNLSPARGGKQFVYREEDGVLHRIPIVTGISDGVQTEVIEGEIKPGMEVVVNVLIDSK